MRGPNLPDHLRPVVSEQSPLWPLTTMRIGGPARWLAQPRTLEDLNAVLAWASEHELPTMLLGGGANVLFHESGFPGVVIRLCKLKGFRVEGSTVRVASGESLSSVAHRLAQLGLAGMEWASGIPGTIGGAVVMNAGTRQADISSILSGVQLLDCEGKRECPAIDLQLAYRSSALKDGSLTGVVLEASFLVREDEPQRCLEREREVLALRRRAHPAGASSGCIFMNPGSAPPAGQLLDQAGCKGMRVGAACVSEHHANFILNEGRNNALDVFNLIEQMARRVADAYGIELDLEVVTPSVSPA